MPNIGKPLVNEDGSIGNCHYCRRQMLSRESSYDHPLHPTREHVVPRAHGGTNWVWVCYQCNHIKGDRTERAWRTYMAAHPRWWGQQSVTEPAFVPTPQQPFKIDSYADSIYILRHGKKAWRAMKVAGEIPTSVQVEYPNDPQAQAAFEAVYRDRLHLLRN